MNSKFITHQEFINKLLERNPTFTHKQAISLIENTKIQIFDLVKEELENQSMHAQEEKKFINHESLEWIYAMDMKTGIIYCYPEDCDTCTISLELGIQSNILDGTGFFQHEIDIDLLSTVIFIGNLRKNNSSEVLSYISLLQYYTNEVEKSIITLISDIRFI